MKKYFVFLSLLFWMPAIVRAQTVSNHTFLQDIKTSVTLPEGAGIKILKLFKQDDGNVAVTDKGVFHYRNGHWKVRTFGPGWVTAALAPEGTLWLASPKSIQSESGKVVPAPPIGDADSITCLYWENKQTLHIGTTSGFFTWKGNWQYAGNLGKAKVNAIASDIQYNLWVATLDGLWRRSDGRWVNLDNTVMSEGNERKYYSVTAVNERRDILFSSPHAVGGIVADGYHWIKRGVDGLPFGPVTTICQNDEGQIWMGTRKGAIRKDSSWHYYAGKRWLPDDQVNDILQLDPFTVWIATSGGISQIKQQVMTLEQKSDSIERIIAQRHNRIGLVNYSRLKTAGDLRSSYTQNEDNDGLWTSCYLAAECFRYAVTKDPVAKANATRTFEALERLETVTGISGYPARSYALGTDKVTASRSPHPKNWHFSADSAWQWLDDTSSDEITGHLFTLPLFFDLVADEGQKKRIKDLSLRIVDHIIDNDFHLIDFDKKPTRWGIWHPDSLNGSPNWMYERGLNSLQILSFLKTAQYFSDAPKYKQVYQMLVDRHGYLKNALQAKMLGPFEISHSDDILNFFPYYSLLTLNKQDPNRSQYAKSLARSWNAIRSDRMPVWNIFASALLNKDCDLKVALEEIEQFPLDLINWDIQNGHRWDLKMDQLISRSRQKQTIAAIPSGESNISRWNTNPKHLGGGDGGKTEESGSYFLFAYWMGRYYGFWK